MTQANGGQRRRVGLHDHAYAFATRAGAFQIRGSRGEPLTVRLISPGEQSGHHSAEQSQSVLQSHAGLPG